MPNNLNKFIYATQNPQLLDSPMERWLYDYFRDCCLLPTLQFPLGPYFLDFAFPDHKIAVEYDGGVHLITPWKDKKKTKFIMAQGWRVFRVRRNKNQGILNYDLEDNGEVSVTANLYRIVEHLVKSIPNCRFFPVKHQEIGEWK